MTEQEISKIVEKQQAFFTAGRTLPVAFRKDALKKLQSAIKSREGEIAEALKKDLGKSTYESYMSEIGIVLSEITYMLKHMSRFSKKQRVRTPLAQFHSSSYKLPSPRGVVLIMSPWNYPFMLTLDPLVDALAAGNTAVIKPSAYSPNVSAVIATIIAECFEPQYIVTVTGGRAENTCLLRQKFDYIFFTGSQAVGKEVMRNAAEHLTPITLELGGKSPCFVTKDAHIPLAAKRIVFGKYLNCGQTCVAPDYILCDASVKDAFVKEVCKEIASQFGPRPLENPEYGKIINEKHFTRILSLIDKDKVVYGGDKNVASLQIEPTVLDGVTFQDGVMQEEIFGPLMPIITYTDLDQAVKTVQENPHPLALYIFTENKKTANTILSQVGFGGGCINDTIIHLATSEMGFGGFGESGMGNYHGKDGFMTFSHLKSIVDKKTWLDLPMRYHPYTAFNEKLLRMFLK